MGGKRGTIGINIDNFTSIDNRSGWCSSSRTSLHGELTDESRNKPFLVRHWTTISRAFSLCLVLLTWCLIMIFAIKEQINIGFYMVFLATIVTFFETMFIFDWLFGHVERKDTKAQRLWEFLENITTWKKLLMYIILTIPAFVRPNNSPVTLACGIIINIIGVIDFIHLFRDKTQRKPIRYSQLGVTSF
uniref:Uncharacterized protein n=1 Tax=Clytia hemisphaerica TaxID=252671 RepID=A0A7M5VC22_9CNID